MASVPCYYVEWNECADDLPKWKTKNEENHQDWRMNNEKKKNQFPIIKKNRKKDQIIEKNSNDDEI